MRGIARIVGFVALHLALALPAVLDAVRFNLKRGASRIKILMGGDVASAYNPPGVSEFATDFVFRLTDGSDVSARREKT